MALRLRQVVLDTEDVRGLAAFYLALVGGRYRPGDEPPVDRPDDADWIVIRTPEGARIAFQQVAELPRVTWPEGSVRQQLHLDFTVPDTTELERQRAIAVSLGAEVIEDRSSDPDEALYVFADPSGHPFCIFVASDDATAPPTDW